jgi:hypothetical protein
MIFQVGDVKTVEITYPHHFDPFDLYFFKESYSRDSLVKIDGLAPLVIMQMMISSLATKEGLFLFLTPPQDAESVIKMVRGKHSFNTAEWVFVSKTMKNQIHLTSEVNHLKSFDDFARFLSTKNQ